MARSDLELLGAPLWRPEDLGRPLPDSPHAVSVCLPRWADVVAYEENDPAVRAALRTGYPRFVYPPQVRALMAAFAAATGHPEAGVLPYPTAACAARCAAFLRDAGAVAADARPWPADRPTVHFATFDPAHAADAKAYWQHYGEVVSSRRAAAALAGAPPDPAGGSAKAAVRRRIAGLSGAHADDVFLYPSGMNALAAAVRAAQTLRPGAKTAQIGFPYVDVLKVQTVRGPGAHFFPEGGAADVDRLAALLDAGEPVAAVVCEFPGNPLLRGADLPRLAGLLRPRGIPLIVDDTPGTFFNVDALRFADIVISSLTKAFSGVGDVLAGSLALRPDSPVRGAIRAEIANTHEDALFADDAVALEANARDFEARMARVNATAETLCDALRGHPAVARLYYPKYEIPAIYAQVGKPGGGYGGLFSLLLRDPAAAAPRFYDRLRVSKGPSLGNNFTMACPYTLLAHYDELPWVESLGVSRHLVRISVGLEDAGDLLDRFREALA